MGQTEKCIAQRYSAKMRAGSSGLGIFLVTTASRLALRPSQLPTPWVPGALSLRVNRPRREAEHSPPPSTEFKNAWSYTSTPQHAFMV